MNFLQSISSAVLSASSAALSGSNAVPGLPAYTLGERVPSFDGRTIWTLYEGTKKDDSTSVSVFSFDLHAANPPSSSSYGGRSAQQDRRPQLALAKNAFRKLRALRHPNILKFLDGAETDSAVWIVTEQVDSLASTLANPSAASSNLSEESKVYGLLHVSTALSFLNKDGASIHGNLRPESIWLTKGGEWKLGGFEVCTRKEEESAVIWTSAAFVPGANLYVSPEVRRYGWGTLKDYDPNALDSYQLHLLIHIIFNGPLPPAFAASSDQAPTLPTTRGSIPASIFQAWRRLGNPNPRARLKTEVFLELGNSSEGAGGGWWPSNRLVKLSNALENLGLATDGEKSALMRTLKDVEGQKGGVGSLPTNFLRYKVLPSLVHNFEFGGGGPALLPVILSLAAGLDEKQYQATIMQPLIRMFAIPDRAMRMALLEGLEKFADKLSNKDVVEKVWPHFVTGFGDVVPLIREATVKSVLLLAPKLNERILNNDLLRQLARVQTDAEPGIRTNTCILLGRLSKHLQPSTNRKVLVPAFARALRDPFVHARIAGLMALMATTDCYEKEDIAGKVIPAMSICLIDRERVVREQGYKAIDMFVKKCEQLTANMPDTVEPVDQATAAAAQAIKQNQPGTGVATNAASAAGVLASWAFASVSKKLSAAEASAPINRADSPAVAMQASAAPPQLNGGAAHVARPSIAESISSDRTGSEFAEAEDWGGDLMDVNDDDGDWNEFETGPPKIDPLAARLSTTKPKTSILGAKKGPLKLGSASRSSALRIPMDMDATDSWDLDETPKKVPVVRPARPTAASTSSPAKPVVPAAAAPRQPGSPLRRIATPPLAGGRKPAPTQNANGTASSSPRAAVRGSPRQPRPAPSTQTASRASVDDSASEPRRDSISSRAREDSFDRPAPPPAPSVWDDVPAARPTPPLSAAVMLDPFPTDDDDALVLSSAKSLSINSDPPVREIESPGASKVDETPQQAAAAPPGPTKTATQSSVPMTKEERAAKLAAAREERKARLAAAKQRGG